MTSKWRQARENACYKVTTGFELVQIAYEESGAIFEGSELQSKINANIKLLLTHARSQALAGGWTPI